MEGIEVLFDPDLQAILEVTMEEEEFERLNHYLGIILTYPGDTATEQLTNWTDKETWLNRLEWTGLANKATAALSKYMQQS